MKRLQRLLSLVLVLTTGCTAIHRHPVAFTVVSIGVGVGVGVIVSKVTTTNCPSMINGYPYQGTPPCPGPNYDPGRK